MRRKSSVSSPRKKGRPDIIQSVREERNSRRKFKDKQNKKAYKS